MSNEKKDMPHARLNKKPGVISLLIKSATALRNDYNGWEKRQAELNLLAELLNRERNRLAGAKTSTQAEIGTMVEELLREDRVAL